MQFNKRSIEDLKNQMIQDTQEFLKSKDSEISKLNQKIQTLENSLNEANEIKE